MLGYCRRFNSSLYSSIVSARELDRDIRLSLMVLYRDKSKVKMEKENTSASIYKKENSISHHIPINILLLMKSYQWVIKGSVCRSERCFGLRVLEDAFVGFSQIIDTSFPKRLIYESFSIILQRYTSHRSLNMAVPHKYVHKSSF